jgi:ATP-dependent helicase HrpB
MVAVSVEQSAAGRRAATLVRLASGIEAEWLLDNHPALLTSDEELEWNPRAERVDVVARVACGSVVLEESRARAPASEAASQLLARAALSAKASDWMSAPDLVQLRRRIAFAQHHQPDLCWPLLEPEQLEATLRVACAGKTSFAELASISLADAVRAALTREQRAALDRLAPEHVRLPGGRNLPIHYEGDRPPWVASRLQDFFGMHEGPRVADGQVALTLHLLAPNQRAVQVTQDLAGFWQRHYPGVRKELMRRYPKHDWPEDGAHATPPPAGRSRGGRRR